MLNFTFTARIALARAQANPGVPVPRVATSTTTTTTDTPITTDAVPAANAAISDEADRFFDASPEDFSTIEVGRSAPPPSNNNDGDDDEEHDAFFNASNDFWDEEEDEGNDHGSVSSGGDNLNASLFEDRDYLAGVASGAFNRANFFDDDDDEEGEEDENVAAAPIPTCGRKDGRPVARPIRRVARGNVPVVDAIVVEEETAAADGAAIDPVDSVAESIVVGKGTSPPPPPSQTTTAPLDSERTDVFKTSVADVVGAQSEPTFVKPVVAADIVASSPPPPTFTVPVVEEDVVMASPSVTPAHFEPTSGWSSVLVPSFVNGCVPVLASGESVTGILDDPMDIDGPEFFYQDIGVHGEPMDIDLLCPAVARQLSRLLGVARFVSGVSRGRDIPCGLGTSRASRVGARFLRSSGGVRRVSGSSRKVPKRSALRRRVVRVSSRT